MLYYIATKNKKYQNYKIMLYKKIIIIYKSLYIIIVSNINKLIANY